MIPESTPHVLATDDPARPFWEQVRQARLQELAALNRLLGYEPTPPRRRGKGSVRVWHNEEQEGYKVAS